MKSYTIAAEGLQAEILPEKGATLTQLSLNGTEYLYRDPENLASPERPRCGVPFLFPMFGRLKDSRYTWEGNTYHMEIHGFAHTSRWEVAEHRTDLLRLVLTENDETLAQYPFSFRVEMTYRIEFGLLAIELRFENTGKTDMPFNYGFHPYFLTENLEHTEVEARADARIDFATGKALPFGHDVLTLSIPQGAPEAGAALAGLHSPAAIHISRENRHLTMAFDASYNQMVLWTQAGKPFLCVEPINGSPNGLNTGNYLTLKPGEVRQSFLRLRPL